MSKFKPRPYWHIHHGELLEWNTEPIKNRREYIKAEKPIHERALRLRLLKPVKGKLPAAIGKAWAAYCKAQEDYCWRKSAPRIESRYLYQESRRAHNKVLYHHKKEIEALHAKECPDCPWDGKTIFPEETK